MVNQNKPILTISPNLKTKKQRKMEALTGKKSAQHVFNSVLADWIVRNGGAVSISGERLRNMPNKVTIKGDWDEAAQSMILTTVVKQGDIITNQGLFVGRD